MTNERKYDFGNPGRGIGALLLLLLLFLAVAPAWAQSPPEAPRVVVSGAYSFVRSNLNGGADNQNALGASAAVRLATRWSGRFDYLDLSGSKPDGKVFLFGPEFRHSLKGLLPGSDTFKPEKFEVFATVQGGNVRSVRSDGTKDNDFAYGASGGLDFTDIDKLGGHFTIRAFEFRYLHSTLWDKGISFKNNFVAQTGINIRF